MEDWRYWAALAIFASCYAIIALPRLPHVNLDRPGGTLLAATLLVLLGILAPAEAWRAIDARTIVLLFGMMVLNVMLERAGFFALAADLVLRRARSPAALLVGLAILSGLLSALFLNDTICLMFTPPLLRVLRRTALPRVPYLITLAMSANVGGVMTITGNPQNMLIGVFGEISYTRFLLRMLPVGLVGLAAMIGILLAFYRDLLRAELPPAEGDAGATVNVNRPLLIRSLLVTGLVLIGFVVTGELALTALAGATALLFWSPEPSTRVLREVDWVLLLFFAALFVVVAAVEKTGLVQRLEAFIRPWQRESLATQIPVFSALSVVGSNLVSNVPYVLLVRDTIPNLVDPPTMWLVLAMASTFAGNLSIPGSVATLIVLESARDDATVGFWEFLRVGIPVTLVTTALGAVILGLQAALLS